ncbi:MAG: hypothetical protein HRU20_23080 [Pseudomonadales bacterium]|nr:hypothetical protein [Pseudomonadales bacterium]
MSYTFDGARDVNQGMRCRDVSNATNMSYMH